MSSQILFGDKMPLVSFWTAPMVEVFWYNLFAAQKVFPRRPWRWPMPNAGFASSEACISKKHISLPEFGAALQLAHTIPEISAHTGDVNSKIFWS